MKILHTVVPAEFGGLESVVTQLALELRAGQHEVWVLCVVGSDRDASDFRATLERGGVTVIPVAIEGRSYRKEVAAVERVCRDEEPDVIHMHGHRSCVLHRIGADRAGVPTVATLHGFTGGGLKNRIYEFAQIRAVRSFDAVIAVSRPIADRLRASGVSESRLHLIRNAWAARSAPQSPVEARRVFGADPGTFHVGWVGRLSHEKGPDVFVDALARTGDPDRTLVSIVGDGPLRAELEQRASGSGGPAVQFHGVLPEVAALLTGFDVFVLSSRTEGTPMVLFEAMAAGVPIVATAVGGVPDVLSDRTAVLVPSEDPVALADAIAHVRSDPEDARHRAAAARDDLIRRFSVGRWLEAYEGIYEGVARG